MPTCIHVTLYIRALNNPTRLTTGNPLIRTFKIKNNPYFTSSEPTANVIHNRGLEGHVMRN